MNTVLATIVTIVLFVPVAIYFFSVVGRDRERPEPEPQETPQVEEDGTAVIVTVNRPESNQTTNVALTWIKQVINGGRDKPAIEPPAPKPAPQNDGPEWTPR
jgi:heme/copper-type cytochrome/quinol oxidase subunit 2